MSRTAPSRTAGDGEGHAGTSAAYRYNAALAETIELRWQAWWEENGTFRTPNPGDTDFDAERPSFYCLDMFPYPSGAGLHVGHPEGYTASDIVSRYQRLRGYNVLHPMGWDAFGLPAEQYAIETGVHPSVTTRSAIDNFRRQLRRFGFCYDWSREFATIDESYYRWTQWIWLLAYDAWFDQREDKAKPIDVLVRDLERGDLRVTPERAPVAESSAGADDQAWGDLDENERRAVIDGQRLAYTDEQIVNWCPTLGTALANEEVIDGRSERGGHPVLRKPLRQWMFRITAYADRLLADLDLVRWPDSTRTQQQEWIGRSEGADVDFALVVPPRGGASAVRVYTTRPDTIFGATYMVLAPEHPLVACMLADPAPGTNTDGLRAYADEAGRRTDIDRMAETREKTGVDTGFAVTNPATGAEIPIWVADYVLMGYGHGAIMAVPAHDERDFEFARTFDLPITKVVEPTAGRRDGDGAFAGVGRSVNSRNEEVSLDGLETADAKRTIIDWLERSRLGRPRVNYKLRDWLFSRQRYWGEPIPIVYDEHGHHHPVDAAHLPVILPEMTDYHPTVSDEPAPLLAKATEWVNTTAGEAGVSPDRLPPDTPVRRETNTMPGWAGSCWYYLRFCDPHDEERFAGRTAERYWMHADRTGGDGPAAGVDLYIGGAEHAVLHLLYARFWHKLLHDFGEVSTPEPFSRLFHQGVITSFAYQRPDRSLVAVDEVEEREDGSFAERKTGEAVQQVTAKMSKSLKNVVNPDDVIAEFGADAFRLYEMYLGPLEQTKPWNTRDIQGVYRFLQRVWRLAVDERTGALTLIDEPDEGTERLLHRTIAKVGGDIERLAFNTAIAAMIELVNEAYKRGGFTTDQLSRFALILSPFAPHFAEELWSKLGHEPSIATAKWPAFDEAMLREDEVEMPVQILGKVRGRITVAADADEETVRETALNEERIRNLLAGKTIRKVIVIPGKIVNIIAQ